MKRRSFIKNAALSGAGLTVGTTLIGCIEEKSQETNMVASSSKATLPLVIATWHVEASTAKSHGSITSRWKCFRCSRTRLYD